MAMEFADNRDLADDSYELNSSGVHYARPFSYWGGWFSRGCNAL